jgi:branched-chain amino acid transport system substrate-binding protein
LGLFAATPPALEQSAQWTDIARRFKADWVITQLVGGSGAVSIKEAARVGFPMDRVVAQVWASSEHSPTIAGADIAKGYIGIQFHGVGREFPLVKDILEKVYDAGKGHGKREDVGTVYYNRGLFIMGMLVEAFRLAHDHFGDRLTPDHMKWGLEHLTSEVVERAGLVGLAPPLSVSEDDHEGGGFVKFYQWDGEKFVPISDWISAYRDVVKELIQASAAKFRQDNPEFYK